MRKQYYEVLDLLSEQLKRRFDQPDMIQMGQIETILLDSACGKKLTTEELRTFLGVHESDFNIFDLHIELHRFPKIFLGAKQ